MKKIFTFLTALIFTSAAFALTTEAHKNFIKGNITDKTAAVRESSGDDALKLAELGIEFVLENISLIGSDRDLSALAVASVLKLPKDQAVLSEKFPQLNNKLVEIFNLFEDENVRIAVLERLETTASQSVLAVDLMNSYLTDQTAKNTSSAVTGKVITCLGSTGNPQSLSIIYECWKNNSFPSFKTELEKSLLTLAATHKTEAIKKISVSNTTDIKQFFDLIKTNENISTNFKAEIAENALSAAIHNTGDTSGSIADSVELQLACLKTISDANWTRAAGLTVRLFSLAKEEYEKEVMTVEQFCEVIENITKLATSETAQTLSGYLAELNTKTEKNITSAQNVVLTVIHSLGALGDKSAFDNLLSVTYLNYPETVIGAARDSLAKLKW